MFTLTLDAPAVGCSRLVLDLDGLTSWDDDATYAVVGCTRLARWVPEGVHVLAGERLQRGLGPRPGPATSSPDEQEADTMAACHAS